MKLHTRIHEWLADRISWVQYPDVRAEGASPRFGLRWSHTMPTSTRLFIAAMSLLLLGVAIPLFLALLFAGYLFVTSL